jgi:EAL domain-containing protein (putative c-di-GMP-specific phosphodiesterase class I)
MARDLGMDAIAEGVETAGQLDELERSGCKFVQGYYLSLPLEGEMAEELLREKIPITG